MLSNLLDTHVYRFLSNKIPAFSAITRGGEGISFFNHHSTTPTYAFETNSAAIDGSEIPMKHLGVAQFLNKSSCAKRKPIGRV